MPLNTNLSSSPYFDDFDRNNDYYRILFKPATAVQVREVNQLQTILQDQIEQFGDHILKAGTILDGCSFSYQPSMPYVKILDSTKLGAAIDLSKYVGMVANGQSNGKKANITHIETGFESDGINLKTLYLDYEDDENNTSDTEFFVQGEELQIFSRDNRLWELTVTNNASGAQVFSNNDVVVITPAIEVVTETDGNADFPFSFSAGDTLTDSTGTIDLILTHDATDHPDNNSKILRIKPNPDNMYGSNIDTDTWDIAVGDVLTHDGGNTLKIVSFVGEGATGSITTTSTGQILRADITRGGSGYEILPHVSLYSVGATSNTIIGAVVLDTQNWYQTVQVAQSPVTDPVGFGYGMNIAAGKIYQKGLFLNVASQFKMVSKYSNTPSDLSVGFDSVESVINVFTDSSLYDNAAGFTNASAPGADRLKLTPVLTVKTDAEEKLAANYFALVRFSEGKPYSQNKTTQYNKIGDMLAQRTYEESGNYTLDEFNATTRSTLDFTESDTTFSYVIDPGHAYIGGYRVKTETNFVQNVSKGIDTANLTSQSFNTNIGVYVEVNELGGLHSFNDGGNISLRDSACNFLTDYDDPDTVANTSLTDLGNEIGTAKIRGLMHKDGIQGSPNAVYRLFVYDIQMNKGKNFRDVKSIFTGLDSGAITDENGIADIVLVQNNEYIIKTLKSDSDVAVVSNTTYVPSAYGYSAVLEEATLDSLVYQLGGYAAKELNNHTYRYRAVSNAYMSAVFSGGSTKVTITRIGSDLFPYDSGLSDVEENDIILIPNADVKANTAISSNTSFTVVSDPQGRAAHYQLTGTAGAGEPTLTFATDLEVGDWLTDAGTTGYAQVVEIAGQDRITIRTSGSGAIWTSTIAAQDVYRIFPEDVPIPLDQRTGMNATTNGAKTEVEIDFGHDFGAPSSRFTAIFDQNSTSYVGLTPRRGYFALVDTAGSWAKGKCLGHSGIFRLNKVYNGTTPSAEDITTQFYIDPNHMPGYWGLGYLFRRESSTASLAAQLLVEFDYLTDGGTHGAKMVNSYPIADDQPLATMRANTTPVMHTMEIPEMFSSKKLLDLRECVDFRPMADATANTTTSYADATVASTEAVSFTNYTTFKFPKHQSSFTYDLTHYIGRNDEISVNADGKFEITTGARDLQNVAGGNKNKLSLFSCTVAPYPSLPHVLSLDLKDIVNTGIRSQNLPSRRRERYTNYMLKLDPQQRVFTMNEIAKLETRVSALEYNQNLSALENETKNRSINSSVDSTIERFKYGFFVDNFENFSMSADVPYYKASIYEYTLQPMKSTINIDFNISNVSSKYRVGNKITFPFVRKNLVSQTIATYAPYVEPPVITIEMFCDFETNRNSKYNGQSTGVQYETLEKVWEEFTFIATDEDDGVERNVEIRFFNPSGGIAYEVIQTKKAPTAGTPETGTVLISPSNSGAIVPLPADEAIELYKKLYPVKSNRGAIISYSTNPWFEPGPTKSTFDVYSGGVDTGVNYVQSQGTGKIVAKYNKSNGRYITVRVHKKQPVFNFEVCYPATVDSDSIYDSGQSAFSNPPPACPKGTFKYKTCVGTTLQVYQCDGNYGIELGYTVPNSPQCTVVVTPPVGPKCPPSGTFAKTACSGTSKKTYVYTGTVGTGIGNCKITVEDTEVCAESCGCKPTVTPPVTNCDSTSVDHTVDDGCTTGDPECNIKTTTPTPVEPVVPPSCFVYGTKIDMADGSQKNIEDIEVGDEVKAVDGLIDVVSHVHDIPVYKQSLWRYNDRITSTDSHVFMTTAGWKSVNPAKSAVAYKDYDIEIGQLEVGDQFIAAEGVEEITSLVHEGDHDVKVYNFTTQSSHTYLVDGVLSHNKQPPYTPPVTTPTPTKVDPPDTETGGGATQTPTPPPTQPTYPKPLDDYADILPNLPSFNREKTK